MKNFNNERYYIGSRPMWGNGVGMQFKFPNGYIADVVRHAFSYGGSDGLWEVAVMYENRIVYDTPVTDDVLGWLSDEDVESVLLQIRQLPARQ